MKRIKYLIFAVIILMLLTSCKKDDLVLTARVEAPTLERAPIEGKWHIEKIVPLRENSQIREEAHNVLGKKAGFNMYGVFIAEDYISEPSYSVRRVNATEFLKTKYNISANQFDFKNKKVDIITIYNKEQPYFEILLENEERGYLHHGDIFLILERDDINITKDEMQESIDENKKQAKLPGSIQEIENTLILGLRTYKYDEKNNLPSWVYNTICLRFTEGELISAVKVNNLITPRSSGFWEVYTERTQEKGEAYDNIMALPLGSGLKLNKVVMTKESQALEKSLKAITFVGSNYISVENIGQEGNVMSLAVNNLDHLNTPPLRLSDIIAEGDKSFIESAGVISNIPKNDFDTSNIGLSRDKGFWTLKGRVNENGDKNGASEFTIFQVAPKEFINYNEFAVSFDDISQRVLDMEDAFLSINTKNLILLVDDELRIYKTDDLNSFIRYKLPPNTNPVMSEWAIGRYSEIWTKEFENMRNAEILSFEK